MSKNDHVEKGPGLARGPALIVGALLAAAGLILFLKTGDTPTGTFPDGTQNGPSFLGFETNGWTAWLTTAAGALLLFGAAQHLLAKTMSLIVGLALGAASVIALVDGDDVLGLAAANGPVKLAWGIAAAVLLVNTLLPRVKKKNKDHVEHTHQEPRVERPVATPPAPRRTEPVVTRPLPADPVPATQRVVHDPRDERPGGLIDPADDGRRDGSINADDVARRRR